MKRILESLGYGRVNYTELHLRTLKFLHRVSNHNLIQPVYPDGKPVYDPLVLLELGEMRCGQVNRLAVDLFEAVGLPGRIAQLGAHQIAEIYYEGSWHYFDADIFGNGETVAGHDSQIPSLAALSQDFYSVDALASYLEPNFLNRINNGSGTYPSWFYFSTASYTRRPTFLIKTASREEASKNRYYGWRDISILPDKERRTEEFEASFWPGAPLIRQIEPLASSPKISE